MYVITKTERPTVGKTTFYNGNIAELVQQLKAGNGKNIYCDGGAEIINELLKSDLIDEFITVSYTHLTLPTSDLV